MMASLVNLRQRKRKRCRKCNQELSHSAYARHLNPSVCPEVRCNTSEAAQFEEDTEDNVQEENSAENGDALQEENSAENVDALQQQAENADALQQQVLAGDDSDGAEACDSRSVYLNPARKMNPKIAQVAVKRSTLYQHLIARTRQLLAISRRKAYCSSDLYVFKLSQLCYQISEQAISLLLSFLKTLLSWLGSYCPEIKTLRDVLPQNIYFLRKLLGRKSEITCFVVCPNCNSLYRYKDCVVTHRTGLIESAKCSFIQYPNHPQLFRRTKCNTLLMKMVKHG